MECVFWGNWCDFFYFPKKRSNFAFQKFIYLLIFSVYRFMIKNQKTKKPKKFRDFLYIFLILFAVFQGCKPKYLEEIKPLENPALALSKKASSWWQNQQNQPKPQRRGGKKQPPASVATFYPDWENATMHSTTDNKTKIIAPLWRTIRVKYYYPTLRRAVFTLNADSSVANAQIIEIITGKEEILTKYETQLFLNPDATNLKDFSGYVFEYDVQYNRTKFTGYLDGTLARQDAEIEVVSGGGNSTWDCGDNGNPSNPANGNPTNPSTGSPGGSWIIWIGWNPPPPPPPTGNWTPPPPMTPLNPILPVQNLTPSPFTPPTIPGTGGGGEQAAQIKQPGKLADAEEGGGGGGSGGGGGGGVRVRTGGDGSSAQYWRPNRVI